MKAIACTRYGPPETLQLQERAIPIPGKGEIRIQVHATTVTRADTRIRSFTFPHQWLLSLPIGLGLGFGKPRQSVLGMELAGRVESVGAGVTRFKTGTTYLPRHLQVLAAPMRNMCACRRMERWRSSPSISALRRPLPCQSAHARPCSF